MRRSIRRYLAGALSRLLPSGSLAARTAKSGIWMTATNVLQRALQVTMWLVVARLLGPSEIGLMGVALISLGAMQKLSRLGISEALIQREEDDVDRYLDTAWSLGLARGAVIAALAVVAAPMLAGVFDEPRATDVLRVLALSPLINGASNSGIVYFRKRLQFHRHFSFRVSQAVVEFVVAIGLALALGNVWAIVFAHVASSATGLAMSYVLHPYRPRPTLDLDRARELIAYGKWLTVSGIVYFLIRDGDDFVVGALLSSASLGFYQLAYRLANAPVTEITQVISGVVFPAYSKLQDDLDAFREAYHLVLRVTTFLSFPAAVGIIVVAGPFVRAFLGADWVPMVTTLRLIAVYGLVYSVATTLAPVWNALGRPDIGTKIGAIRLVVIAVLVVPATLNYGIEGTAAVVIVAYLFPTMPLDFYLLTSLIETSYGRLIRELAYPLSASLAMGAVVFLLGESVSFGSSLVEFLALVATGILAYGVAALALERFLGWEIESTFQQIRHAVAEE